MLDLTQEQLGEAKLIFELCDDDGGKTITLRDLSAMCAKYRYVGDVLGVSGMSDEQAFQKMLAVVGKSKEDCIAWTDFESLYARGCKGAGSGFRLSAEQQIDLIFESCDVLKHGEISLTEFAAFCIKRPIVAEVVGMRRKGGDGKRRKKSAGADDLFALIDTDRSGHVNRQELRAFVWKQRARLADEATMEAAGSTCMDSTPQATPQKTPAVSEQPAVAAPKDTGASVKDEIAKYAGAVAHFRRYGNTPVHKLLEKGSQDGVVYWKEKPSHHSAFDLVFSWKDVARQAREGFDAAIEAGLTADALATGIGRAMAQFELSDDFRPHVAAIFAQAQQQLAQETPALEQGNTSSEEYFQACLKEVMKGAVASLQQSGTLARNSTVQWILTKPAEDVQESAPANSSAVADTVAAEEGKKKPSSKKRGGNKKK